MDDTTFDSLADTTLRGILDAIDRIDDVEAELSQGVMTIAFEDGGAPFVVNSHRAARQIWMAADRTAWHFDPDAAGDRWTTARAPAEELWTTLSAALSRRLGKTVSLR
jgi:CyaY protein